MTQSKKLDQFYTAPDVAKKYYILAKKKFKTVGLRFDAEIEPSAGDGAFFKLMPPASRIGLDLEPKYRGVQKKDFFDFFWWQFDFQKLFGKKILVVGNPPFGKNASLAIKFFNKAGEFATAIAFIVPRSFQKISVQNKLNFNFKLIFEEVLPLKSFVFDSKPYNVPCVFQIWIRNGHPRQKKVFDLNNNFFIFTTKDDADIAVRRVGGTAGKATCHIEKAAKVSHYFLKLKTGINREKFVETINAIDFSAVRDATAGPRSISKGEFVAEFLKSEEVT